MAVVLQLLLIQTVSNMVSMEIALLAQPSIISDLEFVQGSVLFARLIALTMGIV